MSAYSNPRLVVDLGAISRNYAVFRRSTTAEVAAVVKANSYGLGLAPVARALNQAGCQTYFTAFASEGIQLRQILPKAEIFVLSPLISRDAEALLCNDLKPCLFDLYGIQKFIKCARQAGKKARGALHVETGIHRLGLDSDELQAFCSSGFNEELAVDLVMSHLACADVPHAALNRHQLERFQGVCETFPGVRASFANSAGVFLGHEYHFDLVRLVLVCLDTTHTANLARHGLNLWQLLRRRLARLATFRLTNALDMARRLDVAQIPRLALY